MAESIWRTAGKGAWNSFSAGSMPSGHVHPLAIRAMAEIGHDISACTSKSVELFRGQQFDLVVTVCDNAQEACPFFPGARQQLHWPFDDPATATGSEEERMKVFRRVRDEIAGKINSFLVAEDRSGM